MKVYSYDQDGFYKEETEADESPLEPGIFLMPAFSTEIKPPLTTLNQVAIFDGSEWNVYSNYTKNSAVEINPTTKEFVQCHWFAIGESPTDTYILAPLPPISMYKPIWDSTKWIEGLSQTDIDVIEQNKIANTPITMEQLIDVVVDLISRLNAKGLL